MSHQTTPTFPVASTGSEGSPRATKAPRVVFIHEVSYLDKPVFEMHEFPEGLSASGWKVDFVDFGEHAARSRRHREPASRLGAGHIDLSTVPSVGSGILRRLIAVLVGSVWIPWQLCRWKPDIVVLYAVPTFGWQTVLAARVLGIPVVYRAIDLSSEIRETVFGRLVSWAERVVARRATIVCSNTDQLGDHLRSLGATDVRRVFPGFDRQSPEQTRGDPDAEEPSAHHIPGSVVFMGTLFPFAGLKHIIHVMAPMLRRRPDVKLRILGSGEAESAIRNVIERESLTDSIEMPGFVPYEQLFDELSRSSVAVIPFDERTLTHVALPGKVPQYIRAGLPVVSTPLRGLQELLPEGIGVTYRPMGAGFVDAIEELLSDPEHRNRLVEAGNERLDAVATWEIALTEFESVLCDAIRKTQGESDVG